MVIDRIDGSQENTLSSCDSNPSTVDLAYLRLRLKESQVRELLNNYLLTTPPIVEDIKQAVELRHASDLEAKAHLLKGASSMVTAKEITNLCSKLEHAASTASWDTAAALYEELELSFEQVKRSLSD